MKKFCIGVLLAGCSLVFTQCKKTSDAPQDYSPLTAGSTWTYADSTGATYKLTATNKDTVALNHTYRVITNSGGPNNYLGKNGNEYYRFGSLSSIGINNVEELYLKDNLDVNGTWMLSQAFTYSGFPVTANLTYTIQSKGGTRTVSGKTFNNVIQVHLDIAIQGFTSIGSGDFYYAEGVGMIENTIAVTIPGQPAITSGATLVSYEIR